MPIDSVFGETQTLYKPLNYAGVALTVVGGVGMCMVEYTKEHVRYVEGLLDGMVRAACIETSDDTNFDQVVWERHYGEDILYADVPGYPSEDAKRKEEDPLTILDWDEEREISILVPESTPPTDRDGSFIFTDRTVVTNRRCDWEMFTISDELYRLIASCREARIEILDNIHWG